MQLWVEIVARESIMLATLVALGVGPASLLSRRFDAAARLAMAPVLGLCIGTCVFTTSIWFTAARHTYWLLPILAVASIAFAWRRTLASSRSDYESSSSHRPHETRWRPPARDALALAIVCVVVAAPLSYTLHERHSVGPTGFLVWDAVGYTAETDGMVQQSIREANHREPKDANFVRRFWAMYSHTPENIDAAPLSANLNVLIGLRATDTQGLFLIVFLAVGALGAFAAVRYAAARPSWAAPLAGVLFAGPLFLQLMADGSQAAICGLSVLLPLVAVGTDALRTSRLANLPLLAMLASGLMAFYPLYLPGVGAAAAAVLLATAVVRWRGGGLSRRVLGRAAAHIGALLALVIAFDVVSFTRDVPYWLETLGGSDTIGKPPYHLPASVLPGWVLQTRQFFFLSELAHASPHEVLIGVVLPAFFIAVILVGLWRRPTAFVLLPLILVFIGLAAYANAKYSCPYCLDRNMLPVAPLSIALLALGVAALATVPNRWLRRSSIAVAAVIVIAVGGQTRTERLLFADNSYFPEAGTRTLVSDLPRHAGPVTLEGYGQDPHRSAGELPLTYFLLSERNHEEVSVPSEYTDYDALAYLGRTHPNNPQFDPSYRYVLTRFGGLQTGRRVIARAGPMALEERTESLDATLISGVATPLVRLDKQGFAAVVGPLHLLVVGSGSSPAWVRLRFQTIAQATAPPQPGVRALTTPHVLTVCVRATGTAPVRRVALSLEGRLFPGLVPNEPFAEPEPPQGIQLVAMRAVTHCSP